VVSYSKGSQSGGSYAEKLCSFLIPKQLIIKKMNKKDYILLADIIKKARKKLEKEETERLNDKKNLITEEERAIFRGRAEMFAELLSRLEIALGFDLEERIWD
jgi:hypothetical protein